METQLLAAAQPIWTRAPSLGERLRGGAPRSLENALSSESCFECLPCVYVESKLLPELNVQTAAQGGRFPTAPPPRAQGHSGANLRGAVYTAVPWLHKGLCVFPEQPRTHFPTG